VPLPAAPRRAADPTAGNERLTGITAVVLLVLLAVEGVTIVFLRPLLSVHLFVGLVLIPPVALKLASTGYRFARYYSRSEPYRRRGPPPAALRATAPLVVATTVIVLASGVWLLLAGPQSRDTVLPIHKVSFIVWLAVITIHVLGHVAALPRIVSAEYVRGGRGRDWRGRQLALAVALVAGVAVAVTLVPRFGAWEQAHRFRFDGGAGAQREPGGGR
jgi:hypothetical protein